MQNCKQITHLNSFHYLKLSIFSQYQLVIIPYIAIIIIKGDMNGFIYYPSMHQCGCLPQSNNEYGVYD